MGDDVMLKPFVKWAGGKGQLLNDIRNSYPKELGKSVRRYCEPFVGGGAVLFDLLNSFNLKEIFIGDINAELINSYKTIRDDVHSLIIQLQIIQNEYTPLETPERKDYYYKKRERFNELKIKGDNTDNLEKAALFIFLNKTCFNGLYRVNSKGIYNVPMGAYKKPLICDEKNLLNVSEALRNVIIHCGNYDDSISFINENTFVYLDPPYRPLTVTASFTSYSENLFDDKAQIQLAKFVSRIDDIGARVIISNSDPKNINSDDNFFDNLYKEHNINRITAKRMINCNSEYRGEISELLISNFLNVLQKAGKAI
jgi:DNA adenine methylase